MTTTPTVLNTLQAEKTSNVFRWQFAQTHPVFAFLLITFAWTWLFWLAAVPLRRRNDLLLMLIVLQDQMYRKLPSLARASNGA